MNDLAYTQWKEHTLKRAAKARIPASAQFELTPRCNLDCKMCYVHNEKSNAYKDRELTTQQWKSIFDSAVENGLLFVTLTGGECLLRDDFQELYLHLYKKGVRITVLTNGTLLDDEYIRFFSAYKPETIQISLYGSSDDGYLQVTGHRGFARAVDAIEALITADIPVRVVVTCSRYMKDDYINILRFCKERNYPMGNTEINLFPNRDDPEKDDYYLSQEERLRLAMERALLYGPLNMPPEELPPVGCADGKNLAKGTTCSAGNSLLSVTWEGVAYPCTCMMIGGVSLLETPYAEAWEKVKAAADRIVQGVECTECAYRETCPKCPALRHADFYSGHCDPSVCEMTQKLVAQGIKKLEKV